MKDKLHCIALFVSCIHRYCHFIMSVFATWHGVTSQSYHFTMLCLCGTYFFYPNLRVDFALCSSRYSVEKAWYGSSKGSTLLQPQLQMISRDYGPRKKKNWIGNKIHSIWIWSARKFYRDRDHCSPFKSKAMISILRSFTYRLLYKFSLWQVKKHVALFLPLYPTIKQLVSLKTMAICLFIA